MLGGEENGGAKPSSPLGESRKTYLRSISWAGDRPPVNSNPNSSSSSSSKAKPVLNSKARACLPPLQPLSISRPKAEEWPRAGSDDLGVWPTNPPTPGVRTKPLTLPGNLDVEKERFEFKKDKLAFYDKECSRIDDHIYLGSDAVAKNLEILKQTHITHVLNCVGFVCPEYFKDDFVYKTLWLRDSPSEDITSILYDVFDYFEEVRERNGRVLVHCSQGVSRSTSLVIAYLMWRQGQSFEDAFQHVKAARGVTNPNMGFACQLLQCQKRVHAVPASPNSVLRMYRMAPHSSYDPLHLVPKMVNQPSAKVLDSRGAFIVHVPSAIYVWIGKSCVSLMQDSANIAASQVIRYEKAKGPALTIKEGEEPSEFWSAVGNEQFMADRNLSPRKVDEYDLDFEIFQKAANGGVVPPSAVSEKMLETCLPAREGGWGRLRRKFMKELTTLSVDSSDSTISIQPDTVMDDTCKEVEYPVSPTDPLLPSSPPFSSPDSVSSLSASPKWINSACKGSDKSESRSPDSFLSPSFSPSASDYSNSFTFSPTSSNWSDLSYLSAQPSPSGLESSDPYPSKNSSVADMSCLVCKEISVSREELSADLASGEPYTCLPCRKDSQSIAERRGSNPPPRMVLPSVEETSKIPKNMVRSWSFSLPDLEDHMLRDDAEIGSSLHVDREESMDANEDYCDCSEMSNTTEGDKEVTSLVLYQWPSMDKVEIESLGIPDSRSVYIIHVSNVNSRTNNSDVLYIWVGRDVSSTEGTNPLNTEDGSCQDSHIQWQIVGRDFLIRNGLATSSLVQVVREGEEPEQLWKHLNCFSFQNALESSHS